MSEEYIQKYIIDFLENTYNDELEQLKAICYGLEYILNSLEYKQENNDDIKTFNTLTTCSISIQEIIKRYDYDNSIPF